jgi:hypothetical protein
MIFKIRGKDFFVLPSSLHISCNDVFMLMKNIHIRSQDKQIITGVADFGGYTSTDGPA